jgi:hypothetical protein
MTSSLEAPDVETGMLHDVCEKCGKSPYQVDFRNVENMHSKQFVDRSTGLAKVRCSCRCGNEWVEVWQRIKSFQTEDGKQNKGNLITYDKLGLSEQKGD